MFGAFLQKDELHKSQIREARETSREINRFFKADHAVIIPLMVKEILDEQIARKPA